MEKECEDIAKALEERLETHDNSRRAVQDRLHEFCEGLRRQINEMEENVNRKLEGMFTKEDDRLQEALADIRRASLSSSSNEGKEDDEDEDGNGNESPIQIIERAKAELLVTQSYNFVEHNILDDKSPIDLTGLCDVEVEKHFDPEGIAVKKPTNAHVARVSGGNVVVGFTCLNPYEIRVISEHNLEVPIEYRCLLNKKGGGVASEEYLLKKTGNLFSFTPEILELEATYIIQLKMIFGGRESEWSDEAEFTTEVEKCCRWKECPDNIEEKRKYSVDENNPRIATKIYGIKFSTIISNLTLPTNTVTSWSVKILETSNNGNEIYIGVVPFDINQNDDANRIMCGWYFGCYASTLCSGPPHRYVGKEYGPRKEKGEYVHTGDSVGVVMDTAKGDLSFALNGANFGVAYEGIPLDKPLVPCVLLYFEGDSVELCEYELSERVNRSISTPYNITAKSIALDSITLTWDAVEGVSFYHVEVDESKFWSSSTNVFIKKGLLPDTEHTFRIRAVKENSVSEWSYAVKGRTQKESFKTSGWKECPEYVHKEMEYSVNEKNPRIATKIDDGYGYCTIIGNTALPLNKVTSWGIKVLKSNRNDGDRIFIGVAPSDINQNEGWNYIKCGWYFGCYASALCSGPPHSYRGKEYRPKKRDGEYVHTGDSVGVAMDTAKGKLSFALKGANRGVAYEGIPLNKPLVPCVILGHKGDSVEIITSGEANNEDGSCVIS